MKHLKLLVIIALSMTILSSCKKDHYDVGNVNSVNAEGEVLLPLVSKTTTMMELMERFKIDSLISCHDDGSLYYGLSYDAPNVLKGSDFMRFNDLEYHESFDLSNFLHFTIPSFYETTVKLDLPLHFESDYIKVMEAEMRSGRFDFTVTTNVELLKKIVVRSSNIKDADGNDMELTFDFEENNGNVSFDFDIGGWRFETADANSLTLSLDVDLSIEWSDDTDFNIDININGTDLSLRNMEGILYPYVVPGSIDTTFSIFPSNISGQLTMNDARLRVYARNLFDIQAEFEVDKALVYANDFEAYSPLDPLPRVILDPKMMTMENKLDQKFDCTIQAHDGRVSSDYRFLLSSSGAANVKVSDTCVVDVQLGVEIPFAFNASDIYYIDTTKISLGEIETPDLIESLTLELDITSTLPLNLNGWFYLYDSETGMVTDTLNPDGKLIVASFNEQPVSTTVSIEITKDRLNKALHSDQLIMMYEVDTDARDVKLNADQKLGLFVRAKVKYNGNVEFNNE